MSGHRASLLRFDAFHLAHRIELIWLFVPNMSLAVMRQSVPPRDEVEPTTPLRLGVAATLAFPDGSMTASGLKREAARGRLVVERIAGKYYTSLANIERMRELCRVEAKDRTCGYAQRNGKEASSSGERDGSSLTGSIISPRDALRLKLQRRSKGSLNT